MSDIATEPEAPAVETAPTEPVATEKPKREPKAPVAPKACACRSFEVGEEFETDGKPDRSIDTTGCDRETSSVFAQGHDAKLVSFLVQAEFDGQIIWRLNEGALLAYTGAAHALSFISDPLAAKAEAALARITSASETRKAKEDEKKTLRAAKTQEKADKQRAAAEAKAAKKAETDAAKLAKTSGPRDVPVNVQPGTIPTELPEGLVKIKIGRHEYEATINAETGDAEYVNNTGETVTREKDTYRILTPR